MGFILLIVLAAVEIFFAVFNIVTKNNHSKEKNIVRICEFVLLVILLITGVLERGFRYTMIVAVLGIYTLFSVIKLLKKKEKQYKLSGNILAAVGNTLLFGFSLTLAILCPQFEQITPSGEYTVAEKKYVMTDESRIEEFSDTGEYRSVTVDVFYPENTLEKYPLIVFSHGAFGFYGSNYSTFRELASNGYIVASINHPYHAFFDTDAYGTLITADTGFINQVMVMQNTENDEEEFKNSHEWLKLRTDDMNFVIDTIIDRTEEGSDEIFKMIDTDKIGVIGHSLGGAAAAAVGRERNDITAVIDIDGTLLGEELAYKNGETIINQEPYPIPMLDIFGEDHYTRALKLNGNYANFIITENSDSVTDVMIKNSGHLNFTDLPLFSPILAKQLGVGTVDSRYCITTTNTLIREFFDCHLKGAADPQFNKEY